MQEEGAEQGLSPEYYTFNYSQSEAQERSRDTQQPISDQQTVISVFSVRIILVTSPNVDMVSARSRSVSQTLSERASETSQFEIFFSIEIFSCLISVFHVFQMLSSRFLKPKQDTNSSNDIRNVHLLLSNKQSDDSRLKTHLKQKLLSLLTYK